jgi:molecular chaperone DnaK
MEEYCVGIDLGTTYSCLAYLDEDGSPVVEKNFEQEDTTPSVILFNENGEIIVGSPAKDMAVMYSPERVVTAIKRHMGTEYELELDGNRYTPITLSAAILKKMVNDFNENHGTELKRAVITCPAYFGQNERDATKAAGRVAGLEEVTIINEPTARPYPSGSERSPTRRGESWSTTWEEAPSTSPYWRSTGRPSPRWPLTARGSWEGRTGTWSYPN